MSNTISPKYQMSLIKQIEESAFDEFKQYKRVEAYIKKWQIVEEYDYRTNDAIMNFYIRYKQTSTDIDLFSTLSQIDGELLLKIAIDLGVETPDFIPSIPTFRNEIKSSYPTASATFEKAFKDIEEHPDVAIGLANSALESIIKEILKHDVIKNKIQTNKTLYDQTVAILKEFSLFPNADMPKEIRTIGSSLLNINQNIEILRSEKTTFHGKTQEDYLINDSIYTYFVVNSLATVGLFLMSFYNKKILKNIEEEISINFDDSEEIPF